MPMGAIESQSSQEEILISRLRNPQTKESAFGKVVSLYQETLYWHIRKMVKSHADTDDLLQQTFIKAWKYIGQFRGDAKLKTWLFRIATNECLTFLNREKKRSFSTVDDLADRIEHSHTSMDTLTGDEIQQQLQQAIDILPEKQKLVFNMKYFEDLKYREIQEVVGGSVGSLKASFHHAVKKIEHFLRSR